MTQGVFRTLIVLILPILTIIASTPQAGMAQAQSPGVRWVTRAVTAPGVSFHTLESKAAGTTVSFHVYLPEIYDADSERRFPVLYWLHGTDGGIPGIKPLSRLFGEAIRAGDIPPMIIVFPNSPFASMWCDSKDGAVPMETILIQELIPYIDANFRTVPQREGRLIEGFSMGGYGAARLGFKYPDMFGAVSILAGGPLDLAFAGPRAKGNPAGRDEILQRTFGGDMAYYREQSPILIAEKNAGSIRGRMLVRLAVGAEDDTRELNEAYAAHLETLGIAHTFDVVPGVGHDTPALLKGLREKNGAFYRAAFKSLPQNGN